MNKDQMFLFFLALLGLLLWRNLPGALAFLRPGWLRLRQLGGPERVEEQLSLRQSKEELAELGFAPVAWVEISRPLERARSEFLFHSSAEQSFALLFLRSGEPWLYFVTPFADGARVLTADHRLPPVDSKGSLVGGLPGASPEELWSAHRRRIEGFRSEGHPSLSSVDQEAPALVEAWAEGERHFYGKGKGRGEVRRLEARRFFFTVAGLSSGVATFWGWLGR